MSTEDEMVSGLGALHARVTNLETGFTKLSTSLDENTRATHQIASDTADLVEFTRTVSWIAKIAKPVGYITTAAAGIAALWAAGKAGIGIK